MTIVLKIQKLLTNVKSNFDQSVSDVNSSYCSSTVDDPERLAKVGKYMFRKDVTVTPMFIVDGESCDWVTFG